MPRTWLVIVTMGLVACPTQHASGPSVNGVQLSPLEQWVKPGGLATVTGKALGGSGALKFEASIPAESATPTFLTIVGPHQPMDVVVKASSVQDPSKTGEAIIHVRYLEDLQDPTVTPRWETGHFDGCPFVFDPDPRARRRQPGVASVPGSTLVAATGRDTVRLFDSGTRRLVRTLEVPGAQAIAMLAGGKQALVGDASAHLRTIDLETGHERYDLDVRRLLTPWDSLCHDPTVTANNCPLAPICNLAISPDGQWAAMVACDWVSTGAPLRRVLAARLPDGPTTMVLRELLTEVTSLAFTPDGAALAVGTGTGDTRLFETSTWGDLGKAPADLEVIDPPSEAYSACAQSVSPDLPASLLFTGAADAGAPGAAAGPMGTLDLVRFSDDGKWLGAASSDRTDQDERGQLLWIFDAATGALVKTLPGQSFDFQPDGQQVVTWDGTQLQSWDTSTWTATKLDLPLASGEFQPGPAAFIHGNPTTRRLAYGTAQEVRVRDLSANREEMKGDQYVPRTFFVDEPGWHVWWPRNGGAALGNNTRLDYAGKTIFPSLWWDQGLIAQPDGLLHWVELSSGADWALVQSPVSGVTAVSQLGGTAGALVANESHAAWVQASQRVEGRPFKVAPGAAKIAAVAVSRDRQRCAVAGRAFLRVYDCADFHTEAP